MTLHTFTLCYLLASFAPINHDNTLPRTCIIKAVSSRNTSRRQASFATPHTLTVAKGSTMCHSALNGLESLYIPESQQNAGSRLDFNSITCVPIST